MAAAGQGTRLGEPIPKAYVQLRGRSLVERSVAALQRSQVVDDVAVIVSEDMKAFAEELFSIAFDAGRLDFRPRLVVGAQERCDSVLRGLNSIDGDDGVVLVHDAARALTPPGMVARIVRTVLSGQDAVIPVLPVADTIKTVDAAGAVTSTPDRSTLRSVQTPQAFRLPLLRRAYQLLIDEPGLPVTDDASLVELLGEQVCTVPGDPMAFKVTTPMDLLLARQVTDEAEPTIFDVPGS